MSWRTSVRKQINKAKSRRKENAITSKEVKANKEYNEKHAEEIHQMGRSLRYECTCD